MAEVFSHVGASQQAGVWEELPGGQVKGSEAWKNTRGHIHSWCKSTDSNDFQAFPASSTSCKGTKCRKYLIYRKPAQKHCRYSKIPRRLLAVHSQTLTDSSSGSVLPMELQRGTSPGTGRGSAARRARGSGEWSVLVCLLRSLHEV